MRKTIGVFGAAILATIAIGFDARPGAAAINYPWCAHNIKGGGGAPTCGYVSFEQCMASVRGLQGTCAMNPAYEPYTPAQGYAKRRVDR